MLAQKTLCAVGVLLALVSAFRAPFFSRGVSRVNVASSSVRAIFGSRSWMSMNDESAAPAKDFSQYSVGQEYSGTLVGAKNFGVFVNINTGTNVLVPRSQLTRGNYEKLKRLSDSKSKEQIKIEIISVSAENSTLSGKYVPLNYKGRPDLSVLEGADVSSKFFNATVVGAHDFGLFAELDEFGVEGLVPASKLPEKLPAGTIQASYPVGSTVKVQVEEFNAEGKKLVLSMKHESRADVGSLSDVSPQTWLQGAVTSVSSFGIFVRPAGHEGVGLVHQSRIPRDLIAALKKLAPIPAGTNKTDIENLFQEGDIVKIRTHSVAVGSRRIELSMLPYKASDDDDDDYVVEGRDPEGEEDRFQDRDDDDEDASYDAESTLLWWRGAPYVRTGVTADSEEALDEEFAVLNESKDVVEGAWRRMFEVDMREDEADFSSKAVEAEMKELEEEIGELNGLDEELVDSVGFGQSFQAAKIGSFVSSNIIPSGWKEEMEFFKDLEATNSKKTSGLRAGKASEQAEFEALLKEVEIELEQAAARAPKVVEPELKVVAEAASEPEEVDAPASA